jgi:hypothetical protein
LPVPVLPIWLPPPGLPQATEQLVPAQDCPPPQTLPQEPQLLLLLFRFVSQPSDALLLLQSP